MNNIIIIAAGEGTRWNNHMGVNKHFVKIDGEPILMRMVRMFGKYPENKITVIAKSISYKIVGSTLFIPKETGHFGNGVDKFYSSCELWNVKDRNIIVYGDCYLSDYCFDKIQNYHPDSWNVYARYGDNEMTGHLCSEMFALSFDGTQISKFYKKLLELNELIQRGFVPAESGGWVWYRLLAGMHYEPHMMEHHLVQIMDWSDDFDYPIHYDNFIRNFNEREK